MSDSKNPPRKLPEITPAQQWKNTETTVKKHLGDQIAQAKKQGTPIEGVNQIRSNLVLMRDKFKNGNTPWKDIPGGLTGKEQRANLVQLFESAIKTLDKIAQGKAKPVNRITREPVKPVAKGPRKRSAWLDRGKNREDNSAVKKDRGNPPPPGGSSKKPENNTNTGDDKKNNDPGQSNNNRMEKANQLAGIVRRLQSEKPSIANANKLIMAGYWAGSVGVRPNELLRLAGTNNKVVQGLVTAGANLYTLKKNGQLTANSMINELKKIDLGEIAKNAGGNAWELLKALVVGLSVLFNPAPSFQSNNPAGENKTLAGNPQNNRTVEVNQGEPKRKMGLSMA
jgi:hypothetical protein